MAAIRTVDLTKRYGDVTAVEGLSLTVAEGEVFGFLGPNGAGKSTTIDLLLDYVRPTAGSAAVLGYDAQAESAAVSRRVGVLPEDVDVYPRLTGRRHLEFAIETLEADDDPDALLDRVGLAPEARDRPAGDYSTGMRQRLALGMALVGDPDLLVLDEPATGLDPHGIRELQALVREEADRGTTVFFSSHILEHVEAVCDRVGVLFEGELVAVDTIAGLRESIGDGATMRVAFAESPADAEAVVATIDGVTDVVTAEASLECTVTDPPAKATVVTALDDAGATIRDLRLEEPSLESLFTTLVGPSATDDATEPSPETDRDADSSDVERGAEAVE
ncbi:ABC transporter ATP-binding protein [Halopiger goleimassiliensis]|uniref:ABC transporter ATP-binding protein n=1 Tax=Halopiger goleimassiliensis TaxID=1293048 RepID=UPI000677FAC5|nr:ABC transporter ATP-binding protein [Halopiger goleimassiliensis]